RLRRKGLSRWAVRIRRHAGEPEPPDPGLVLVIDVHFVIRDVRTMSHEGATDDECLVRRECHAVVLTGIVWQVMHASKVGDAGCAEGSRREGVAAGVVTRALGLGDGDYAIYIGATSCC